MATSVQAAVCRLAAAPMGACAWFEALNNPIGSANHPGQAIQPSCREERVGVRNRWSVPHRHQGPQARGADGCSQLVAALSQWGPLNTDTTINWDSVITAECCCLAAHGAGSRCVAQRRLEVLLASLSMLWDMCGDICFPNLLEPWCVLTIPFKWPQRVLAGEGGARDTEAVRWWLPHSPCHVLKEKAGRGRNNLGVQEKHQGHVLGIFGDVDSSRAGSLS